MSAALAEILTPSTVPAGGRLCSVGREEIPAGARAFADAEGWIICTACATHCASCTDEDCDHPRFAIGGSVKVCVVEPSGRCRSLDELLPFRTRPLPGTGEPCGSCGHLPGCPCECCTDAAT
jgi:hypothetical protein